MVGTMSKVWDVGNTTVVTIPSVIRRILNIRAGDILDINWDYIKVLKVNDKRLPDLNGK